MTAWPGSRAQRLTLHQNLRRTHLMAAFTSACVVGIFLTLIALLAMRFHAEHNLELVARAINYTAEAAVVFRDEEAANEALRTIAEREEVAEAQIYLPDGTLLANWRRATNTPLAGLENYLAERILPGPARESMMRGKEVIAEVRVKGHGQSLLLFLLAVLLVMLVCLLLSAMGALYVAGRMQVSIIGPLRDLAQVAHSVRRQRPRGMRASPAAIVELDELQAWQQHQARENASLLHQATHDALTGLPNRALFEARLEQAIIEVEQEGSSFALLYLDCDRFKQINDSLGHNAGDDVLVTLAKRVQHQLRPQDLVCRLGGDEFAILLSPAHQAMDVEEVITRIQQAMKDPVVLRDEQQLVAGISIGFAIHQPGTSASELCALADSAMYLAKRARREEVDAARTA